MLNVAQALAIIDTGDFDKNQGDFANIDLLRRTNIQSHHFPQRQYVTSFVRDHHQDIHHPVYYQEA